MYSCIVICRLNCGKDITTLNYFTILEVVSDMISIIANPLVCMELDAEVIRGHIHKTWVSIWVHILLIILLWRYRLTCNFDFNLYAYGPWWLNFTCINFFQSVVSNMFISQLIFFKSFSHSFPCSKWVLINQLHWGETWQRAVFCHKDYLQRTFKDYNAWLRIALILCRSRGIILQFPQFIQSNCAQNR